MLCADQAGETMHMQGSVQGFYLKSRTQFFNQNGHWRQILKYTEGDETAQLSSTAASSCLLLKSLFERAYPGPYSLGSPCLGRHARCAWFISQGRLLVPGVGKISMLSHHTCTSTFTRGFPPLVWTFEFTKDCTGLCRRSACYTSLPYRQTLPGLRT